MNQRSEQNSLAGMRANATAVDRVESHAVLDLPPATARSRDLLPPPPTHFASYQPARPAQAAWVTAAFPEGKATPEVVGAVKAFFAKHGEDCFHVGGGWTNSLSAAEAAERLRDLGKALGVTNPTVLGAPARPFGLPMGLGFDSPDGVLFVGPGGRDRVPVVEFRAHEKRLQLAPVENNVQGAFQENATTLLNSSAGRKAVLAIADGKATEAERHLVIGFLQRNIHSPTGTGMSVDADISGKKLTVTLVGSTWRKRGLDTDDVQFRLATSIPDLVVTPTNSDAKDAVKPTLAVTGDWKKLGYLVAGAEESKSRVRLPSALLERGIAIYAPRGSEAEAAFLLAQFGARLSAEGTRLQIVNNRGKELFEKPIEVPPGTRIEVGVDERSQPFIRGTRANGIPLFQEFPHRTK